MSRKAPTKHRKDKDRQATEVIGYPDKPMPLKYIVAAAAAWTAWMIFLFVMAYVRSHEWPFWPT